MDFFGLIEDAASEIEQRFSISSLPSDREQAVLQVNIYSVSPTCSLRICIVASSDGWITLCERPHSLGYSAVNHGCLLST